MRTGKCRVPGANRGNAAGIFRKRHPLNNAKARLGPRPKLVALFAERRLVKLTGAYGLVDTICNIALPEGLLGIPLRKLKKFAIFRSIARRRLGVRYAYVPDELWRAQLAEALERSRVAELDENVEF